MSDLQSGQCAIQGNVQEKTSLINILLLWEEQNQLSGGAYPGWRAKWGTGFVFSI
jgi:hypothetical protein